MPSVSAVSLDTALPESVQHADSPTKIREAAGQFEALLMGQILRSVRQSGGWLGTSDATADCAMEFAEQQFASLLAQQGGLGLAALISQGLRAGSSDLAAASDTLEAPSKSGRPARW